MKNKKGWFITFEGNEGAGKSTHMSLLADYLTKDLNYQVTNLREPGGTQIGEKIRDILKEFILNEEMTPETELLLMNASRAQLVRKVIKPALARGEIVLCDRFYDSTIAYQAYGRALPLEKVRSAIKIATSGLKPDLTFLIDVPLKITYEIIERRRATEEKRDRFEESGKEFSERVDLGYRVIEREEPDRVKVIPYLENDIDMMQKIIRAQVCNLLN